MRNINFITGDNLGGLELLWYADADDIAYIPPAIEGVISGNIQMKPGKVFYVFRPTQGSLSFSEPLKETRIGSLYTPSLKGFVPKDTPQLQLALMEMTGRRLVVLYRDNNGNQKLVGSKDYWLTFERDLDTGSSPSSKNGVGYSFKGNAPQPAPFYTGSFPVEAIGTVEPPVQPSTELVTVMRADGVELARLLPGQIFIIDSGFSFGFRIA